MKQERIPTVLASNNPDKNRQFDMIAGVSIPEQPLFDEVQIHAELHELDITPESGLDYVSEVSKRKLARHREKLRETEDPESDRTIIVSDSVLLVEMQDGLFHAINKGNLSSDQLIIYEEAINNHNYIRTVGAVSFGRKWGSSIFTTLTYMDAPLRQPVRLPLDVRNIPEYARGDYTTGYIDVSFPDDSCMDFNYAFTPMNHTNDFEEASGAISGLIPDVIRIAERQGQLDKLIEMDLLSVIHQYPFNSMGYYTEWIKSGLPKEQFYQMIGHNRREYARIHSGNCSHITMALLDQLIPKGIRAYGLITDITRPPIEDAHSSTVIEYDDERFLVDASLTIPYPIPYGTIPVLPFSVHKGKDAYVNTRKEHGVSLPDLHLMRTKSRQMDILQARKIVSLDDLEVHVPQLLTNAHDMVPILKYDRFDAQANKQFESTFDRKTGEIYVRYTQDQNSSPIRIHYSQLHTIHGLPKVLYEIAHYAPHIMI